MNKNSNIGFIGLGNMGKPIFDNLNKKFSNIYCFDNNTSKLKKNKFSASLDEIFEKCKIKGHCETIMYGPGVEKIFDETKKIFPDKKINIFSSDYLKTQNRTKSFFK